MIKKFSLLTFMLFIMVMFVSCDDVCKNHFTTIQPEKEEPSTDGVKIVYKGRGWSIETYMIDGHKYVVASTTNGVAICPAKED